LSWGDIPLAWGWASLPGGLNIFALIKSFRK
jgi:hypothetical protein